MMACKHSLTFCAICAAAVLLLVCLSAVPVFALPADPTPTLDTAPNAAIDPPFVKVKRDNVPANANLIWEHVVGTDFYEVYRSANPDPQPGVAPANCIAYLPATPYGTGYVFLYTDTGVDNYSTDGTVAQVQVIGNATTNYFWVVQGHTVSMDVSGASNLVGEFDFAIVKGS